MAEANIAAETERKMVASMSGGSWPTHSPTQRAATSALELQLEQMEASLGNLKTQLNGMGKQTEGQYKLAAQQRGNKNDPYNVMRPV